MPSAIGSFLGVGRLGASATFDSALVTRDKFIRVEEHSIETRRGEVVQPTGYRSVPEAVGLGRFDTRLRGTLEGTTEGPINLLLRSLLGNVTSTQQGATAAYKHAHTPADSLPDEGRLSFEQRLGTLAKSKACNGAVGRMRYDFGNPGHVKWAYDGLGGKPELIATPTTPTLPAVDTTLLHQIQHAFTLDSVNVPARSGFWELTRTLQEDDYTASSQFRRNTEYGELNAMFELEAIFANTDHMQRFWGGVSVTEPGGLPTYYPLNIKGEHPTVIASTFKHTVEFDTPRVFITGHDDPIRGRDVIYQRIRGRAFYDAATSQSVTVNVTNTDTSA